jgi:hypothetical protein
MRKYLAVSNFAHSLVDGLSKRTGIGMMTISNKVLEKALKEKPMTGSQASRLYQGIKLKDQTVLVKEVVDLYGADTFEEFLLVNNIRIVD